MKTQVKGARGERLAQEFLEHQGYELIQANFVRRVGEIDLIMQAPSPVAGDRSTRLRTIVFVEVRFRRSSDFGGAIASIDWRKQRKMVRVAQAWLQQNASSRECARIDVVALQPSNNALSGSPDVTLANALASRSMSTPARNEVYHWRSHDLLWIQNAVEATS